MMLGFGGNLLCGCNMQAARGGLCCVCELMIVAVISTIVAMYVCDCLAVAAWRLIIIHAVTGRWCLSCRACACGKLAPLL